MGSTVKKKAAKKSKAPLAPKVTFVGGKWYNEYGKEVPKPQAQQPQRSWNMQQQELIPSQPQSPVTASRLAGCKCARPEITGHVPGCPHFANALYVCDAWNPETAKQLAALAQMSIADLQGRRRDAIQQTFPDKANCPDQIPFNDPRRRCWNCPYWDRHATETPFDHQKLPQESLDAFPESLKEEDDDLPF